MLTVSRAIAKIGPFKTSFQLAPLLIAALAMLLLNPSRGDSAVTACPAATTLEELITCLKDSGHMPRSGTDGFVPPSIGERLDWAAVVGDMLDATLAGTCAGITLPGSLAGLYELTTFTDAWNSFDYCVLAEIPLVGDPDKKAWGTFITNLNPAREIAIQIPHPLNDLDTPEEGIGVFKTNRARSYLLSGSHRNANDTSSCQSSYNESDPAHDVVNMFQPTNEETLAWYQAQGLGDKLVVIQFHGMGTSTCEGVDVYMTYGRPPGDGTPVTGDDILTLEAALESRHPDWTIIVPGETPSCTLNATTNVQGRLLNGVDTRLVCGTNTTSYSGRFIHIEQKRDMRLPADWVDAIAETWPIPTCSDDPDCDDRLWCNGTETCVAGGCQPGTDPCAGGACDEAGQTCTSVCGDGICDPGEDCNGCSTDCPSFSLPSASCGNGLCEASDGENCVTCAQDCAGRQNGKPAGRWCCGFGGDNPVGCDDSRCTDGFTCTETLQGSGGNSCCGDLLCESPEDGYNCAIDCGASPVCGDGSCEPGESQCSCALDCGMLTATELGLCTDGIDNDCDLTVDCADPDCKDADPACQPIDCLTFGGRQSCNAALGCRWDNRNKVCAPN